MVGEDMEAEVLRLAKDLSTRIIMEAGNLIRERFNSFNVIQEKDEFGDVVTEVDLLAEEMIINEISRVFPNHQVQGEESGRSQNESDFLWMVDPLDGTNNFVMGLPIFSSSITLMYKREPVLGVIYEPTLDRLYVSSKQGGSFCNGKVMNVRFKEDVRKGNVGWIQGHKVQNDRKAVCLRQHIDTHFRRMLRLWAPTILWCMLANGNLDGIILYNSEGDDLYSGILMVQEAGGVVFDFEGRPFSGMNEEPYYIACHPNNKDYFLRAVHEGLTQF